MGQNAVSRERARFLNARNPNKCCGIKYPRPWSTGWECALTPYPATPFGRKTWLHSKAQTPEATYIFLSATGERGITEGIAALRQLSLLIPQKTVCP
jgi:hypothetical protein